ncbi:MAG: SurA N-terminal domain-containing protein [Candidatus Pacebacteria bacterium]|nr:SurA N-terminal domain-containing protein [Candidatus Paceibacterota bacterium]
MEELKKQPDTPASDTNDTTDAPDTAATAQDTEAVTETTQVTDESTTADTDTKPAADTEAPAEAAAHTTPDAAATPQKAGLPKLYIGFAVVIAILLVLGVMNQKGMLVEPKTQLLHFFKANSAVATINGAKVTHGEYQTSILEITQNATAQGADVSDPLVQQQIAEQALTALVNTELLVQKAHAEGHTATPEQVDIEYANLAEQVGGTEVLMQKLEELNLTDADLRENIAEQVVITAYLDTAVSAEALAVTDEDIATFYTSIAANGDAPPLEEIRPFLEEQLIAGKQQEFVTELIDTLRAEADVEITL